MLVGDAGFFKDPLSTHGMTDALRDAELVARALAAVLGGADETDALAGYQATRDALSLPLFEVIDAIASHQWTDTETTESNGIVIYTCLKRYLSCQLYRLTSYWSANSAWRSVSDESRRVELGQDPSEEPDHIGRSLSKPRSR